MNDWNAAESGDMRREASVQNVKDLPAYTYGGWADFVQETDYYGKKQAPVTAKCADDSGTTQYAPVFACVMY